MTINVTKYRLNPDRIFAGTRGSYGMEKLAFDFGDGWDFTTLSVTFHPQRGKPIRVPLIPGVEIDIPAEVMAHSGESRFVVSGTVIGGDGTVERKAVTLEGYVDVAYTLDDRGGNTRKITPDMYEQLIDQATQIFDEAREDVERTAAEAAGFASDAEGFANSAEEDADSAKKSASAAETARASAEQIAEGIPKTVQDALQEAKGSGEFDGEDGITPHVGANGNWFVGETDTGVKAQGEDGEPGYTPQKGVDYWTEADKNEMVNAVLAALPAWEGDSY